MRVARRIEGIPGAAGVQSAAIALLVGIENGNPTVAGGRTEVPSVMVRRRIGHFLTEMLPKPVQNEAPRGQNRHP